MSAKGWDVRSVGDADDLLGSCGLIVTSKSSRAPLLGAGGARSPGPDGAAHRPLHVTCVGSDSTGKKELDSRLQTAEQGEFEDAVRSGLVDVGDVVKIGELGIGGRCTGDAALATTGTAGSPFSTRRA